MQEKIITFILPRTGETPIGGFKVVYEYANRLVEDGYTVNIVYGITSRPVKNLIIRYGYYFCRWFRWLKYRISKNYTPEKWFKINKGQSPFKIQTYSIFYTRNILPICNIMVYSLLG